MGPIFQENRPVGPKFPGKNSPTSSNLSLFRTYFPRYHGLWHNNIKKTSYDNNIEFFIQIADLKQDVNGSIWIQHIVD